MYVSKWHRSARWNFVFLLRILFCNRWGFFCCCCWFFLNDSDRFHFRETGFVWQSSPFCTPAGLRSVPPQRSSAPGRDGGNTTSPKNGPGVIAPVRCWTSTPRQRCRWITEVSGDSLTQMDGWVTFFFFVCFFYPAPAFTAAPDVLSSLLPLTWLLQKWRSFLFSISNPRLYGNLPGQGGRSTPQRTLCASRCASGVVWAQLLWVMI